MTSTMLSADHMGFIDAMKYGVTRNDATLAAALAAGATLAKPFILLLPNDGDGIWTFNSAWTIPSNCCLWVAPGAKVNGTGNYTINGQLFTFDPAWYTGSGTATLNFAITSIGAIQTQKIGVNQNVPAASIDVRGDNGALGDARVRIQNSSTSGNATVDWYSGALVRGIMGCGGNSVITLALSNSATFIVTGGNMGVGMAPNFQFQLSTADAYKATGTTWQNPSDPRLKEDIEPFVAGLDLLQIIHPIWYRLKAGSGFEASAERVVGVDAAALQQEAPALVGSYRGTVQEGEEETDILTFKGADAVIFALVNAVKELASRVDALEAKLAAA